MAGVLERVGAGSESTNGWDRPRVVEAASGEPRLSLPRDGASFASSGGRAQDAKSGSSDDTMSTVMMVAGFLGMLLTKTNIFLGIASLVVAAIGVSIKRSHGELRWF